MMLAKNIFWIFLICISAKLQAQTVSVECLAWDEYPTMDDAFVPNDNSDYLVTRHGVLVVDLVGGDSTYYRFPLEVDLVNVAGDTIWDTRTNSEIVSTSQGIVVINDYDREMQTAIDVNETSFASAIELAEYLRTCASTSGVAQELSYTDSALVLSGSGRKIRYTEENNQYFNMIDDDDNILTLDLGREVAILDQQQLSLIGDTISLVNGGSVVLGKYNTIAIDTGYAMGSNFVFERTDGTSFTIAAEDCGVYDDQTLELVNSGLGIKIENGNTIDLSHLEESQQIIDSIGSVRDLFNEFVGNASAQVALPSGAFFVASTTRIYLENDLLYIGGNAFDTLDLSVYKDSSFVEQRISDLRTELTTANGWEVQPDNAVTTSAYEVGIGTTNPSASLQVESGSGGDDWQFRSGGTDTLELAWRENNTDRLVMQLDGVNDAFGISINDETLLDIEQSSGNTTIVNQLISLKANEVNVPSGDLTVTYGNVGIGTTSPSEKLEVAGNLILDADDASISLKSGISGTSGNINWTFNSESTQYVKMGIDYDTRATTGFLLESLYPVNIDYTTNMHFNQRGVGQTMSLANGNVGIGTASPQSKLTIQDNAQSPPTSIWDADSQFTVGDAAVQLAFGRSNVSPFPIWLQGRASNNASRDIIINPVGGNVGIGTASPSAKVQIDGGLTIGPGNGSSTVHGANNTLQFITDTYYGGTFDNHSGYLIHSQLNSGGWGDASLHFSGATNWGTYDTANPTMVLRGNNVGIGTASPNKPLDVSSNSSSEGIQIRGDGTTGIGSLIFNNSTGTAERARIEGNSFNRMIFSTGGADRMTINESGNVGIGTTVPNAVLDVQYDSTSPTDVQHWRNNNNGNDLYLRGSAQGYTFYDEVGGTGDLLMHFNTDGKVGIGTSSPSVELDVIGDIEYTGTITDVSDERLKENFAPIDSALQKVIAINPTLFTMKGSDRIESGYKAQNVQEHFSHVVKEVDEAGTLGLDYTQMISLLHQAIKDQQVLIDSLEARIEELENQ